CAGAGLGAGAGLAWAADGRWAVGAAGALKAAVMLATIRETGPSAPTRPPRGCAPGARAAGCRGAAARTRGGRAGGTAWGGGGAGGAGAGGGGARRGAGGGAGGGGATGSRTLVVAALGSVKASITGCAQRETGSVTAARPRGATGSGARAAVCSGRAARVTRAG